MTDKLNNGQVDPNAKDENQAKEPDGENVDTDAQKDAAGENNDTATDDKKYSDADVDAIIEKKFAKWKAKHEKAVADAKAEAEKLAKMNADQKKDYEMEKLQAENAKLKKEAMRVELGKTATTLLKEQEIDATQDMLDFVVGEDADTTKANIEKFVAIIQSQVKAAEVKRATGETPKSYGSNQGQPEMDEIQKRIAKYK